MQSLQITEYPTIAEAQLWVMLEGGWPKIALTITVWVVEYDPATHYISW